MIRYDKKEKRALAIYVFVFLLVALGIAFSGYLSYQQFEQQFRHQAESQVAAIAELKANQLAQWRRERLIDAQSFYRNAIFSGLVEKYFEYPADVKTKEQIISRLEYYHSFAGYENIFLLDAEGNHKLDIPATPEESAQANAQLMTEAAASLDSKNVIFGDFQRDVNMGGEIYISILIPIFADQSDGRPLGVIVLRIDPKTYLYPYVNQWPLPSDTAETLLVRRDGEDVLFLNQVRFEQDSALNLRYPLAKTDIPAVKAVLGQTGLVEGMDYRGELVLADVRPVPDSPWFMVSKVDVNEVYTPLQDRLWQTQLIVSLAILLAGTGLALVWRQQRILAYRAKAEVAEALRESEEKFRKAFVLSPDSININRLQDGMYVSINNGFTKIMGYLPDEVVEKTSVEMNIWADPQDRQKLVDGLRNNGMVENLEARFRAKNGDIKHGLMSASVLELNGIPHIISITRDVTDRKRAQEALRESEEQFRTIYNNITIGLYRTTPEGRILMLNLPGIRMLGFDSFDEVEKLNLEQGRYTLDYSRNEFREKLEKQGVIVGWESGWVKKDGSTIFVRESAKVFRDEDGKTLYYDGSFEDITERKLAEEALRQSEENLSTTLHSIGDGVISTDKNGAIVNMNPIAEKYCGWSLTDARGKPLTKVFNIINAETRKKVEDPVAKVIENGQIIGLANHTVLVSKNGDEYQIADSAAPIKDKDGQVVGVVLVFSDVTEKYKATEKLRESEANFADIFQTVSEGIAYTSLDGRVISINNSLERILEIPKEQIVGRNILSLTKDLLSAKNFKEVFPTLARLVQGKEIQPLEIEYKNKIIEVTATINRNSGRLTGVVRDITEHRQAEERLEQFFSVNLDLLCVADLEGNFIKVNKAWESILGYSTSEIEHRKFLDFVHPEDMDSTLAAMATLGNQEQVLNFVNRYRCMDGSYRFIEWRAQPSGNLIYAAARDITERKQAEEALRKNEEKMSSIFRVAPTGIGVVRDRVLIEVNPRISEMTGYTKEELTGQSARVLYPTQKEFEWVGKEKYEQIAEKGSGVVETHWQKKDGSIIDVLLASTPIDLADLSKGVTFTALDITERKQTEGALKESEAIFSSFLEHSPVYVFFKDKDIRSLMLSKNYEQMLGMPISDLLGKTMDDLFPSDLAKNMVADDLQVLNEGRRVTVEEEFNGRVYETTKFPVIKDGKPHILAGFTVDITERKQAEEALREGEERLRLAVSAGHMGTWDRNFLTGQLNWSVECKAMFGLAPEIEMNDERFAQALHPEDRAPTDMAIREALEKQTDFNTEYRVIWPDGTIHWIAAQGRGYYDETGQAIHMAGITLDITERKLAEEALIASTEFSNSLITSIQDGISVLNTESMHVMVNPALCSMTGYSREELINCGTPPYPYWPPEEYENIQMAFEKTLKNEISNFELIFMHKNGERFPVIVSPSAVKDGAGNIVYYMATVKDITDRKQAEEALRESESRFRALFEQAGVGVAQLDTNTGRFISINQKYCDILGYSQQEMLDLDFQTITHPDDLVTDLANMQRLIAGEIREFSMEKRYYRKDGSIVWVSLSVSSLWAVGELPNTHIAVVEDITARKQAEEALRESRSLFRSLVESMPQNVFSKDLEGRFIFANQHYCATEGKSLAEIIGKTDFDLHPTHLAEQYWADDRHVIEAGQVIEKEEIHQPLGGEISYVQVAKAPIYDADGQAKGMLGIFWDITDRKRAEEARRESEELYRKMNENSPLGMHFYKLDGKKLIFTGANPSADKLLGVENSQFIGKPIEEAFPPLGQTEVPQRYCDAAANGALWSTEQIVYQDGRINGAFEVKAFQTTPGNMVAVFADITARKQAEEEIRTLNAELEQRVIERTLQLETTNKELEAFSYSVSHDLRAPLRGIDGWSQALLEDYHDQLDEQGRQYIDRVRSDTQRMGRLIDDLLQLSRLTRAEMVKEQVDLSALAQDIVERLKRDEPQRQVDFNIQVGIIAEGDAHLLEVVLGNLLGNAFKFTAKRASALIEFGQTELENQRIFFVRDNGAGFDMTYAQKLFGAFQRMHKASEFPGTGIGLATVQRIIHRHGGGVWAEAEVGHGATFYFTLDG